MSYTHTPRSSTGLAILSAGPTFLLGLLFGAAATAPDEAIAINEAVDQPGFVVGILAVVGLSSLFGAVLSLMPNLIAGGIMKWLGESNLGMRLPVMWSLVGGLAAGTPAYMLMGANSQSPSIAFAFAFTGAVCGLIVRWRIRWDND